MKKLAVITLLLAMLCSLAGCGGKQADSGKEAADGKEAASVETTESTESTESAVTEDQDWQNPVMNFIGEYQCDRAHATIECMGKDEAIITIEWAGSVSDYAHWDIYGHMDTETMTIAYDGCTKSHIVYNKDGEIESEEQEYDDGTGTITFNDDGTFTWHEDQSETGTDMVFEWLDVTGE